MPDYERRTTTTRLDALPEPIRAAVRERADGLQLTLAPEAPAFLTHSRRLKKPGLFARLTGTSDKDVEHLTAMVLGNRDILVATHGDVRGTTVLAARLDDVEVGALDARIAELGGTARSDGVSIGGFPVSSEGTTGRGSYYVGLGPPDGEAARAALEDAVRRAKA